MYKEKRKLIGEKRREEGGGRREVPKLDHGPVRTTGPAATGWS